MNSAAEPWAAFLVSERHKVRNASRDRPITNKTRIAPLQTVPGSLCRAVEWHGCWWMVSCRRGALQFTGGMPSSVLPLAAADASRMVLWNVPTGSHTPERKEAFTEGQGKAHWAMANLRDNLRCIKLWQVRTYIPCHPYHVTILSLSMPPFIAIPQSLIYS